MPPPRQPRAPSFSSSPRNHINMMFPFVSSWGFFTMETPSLSWSLNNVWQEPCCYWTRERPAKPNIQKRLLIIVQKPDGMAIKSCTSSESFYDYFKVLKKRKLILRICVGGNSFTFLTVGFALLHVKGLVPDGSLAGCTLETLNMVGHLQGVHDFLVEGREKNCSIFLFSGELASAF